MPRVSEVVAVRAFGYWLANYRRTWRGTVISGVLEPVFFLSAMGIGLGTIVNANAGAAPGGGLGGLSYLEFVAPALLAANALQTATFETTYPVMGATKWDRTYLAQLATPLRPGDIVAGHLLFVAMRVISMSVVFLAVIAVFGVVASPWAVLTPLVGLLVGLAIACPVAAFAVRQQNDTGFSLLFRFGVMPVFLFSGTFFPVSQLPDAIEWLAYASPLWHGTELTRSLVLGGALTVDLGSALLHVGYLALWCVAGAVLALRAYTSRLVR